MSFGDAFRRLFSRSGGSDLRALLAFASERKGVEGFIEPQTATNPTTLLLVDRNGDHARGAVRDPKEATSFCDRLGLPVYDAAVIGYPSRMKDFDSRRRRGAGGDVDAEIADLERRLQETDPNAPDH